MKAERTKHLIDSLVDRIFNGGDHISNRSMLNAHLAASDRELLELERLARIGSAALESFSEGDYIVIYKTLNVDLNDGCDIIGNAEELLRRYNKGLLKDAVKPIRVKNEEDVKIGSVIFKKGIEMYKCPCGQIFNVADRFCRRCGTLIDWGKDEENEG